MKWTRVLPFIGIAILLYLLSQIDLQTFWKTLITASIFFIIIAVLTTALQVFLQAAKWQYLLRTQGIKTHFFSTTLPIHLKSIFYGSITPGKVGSLSKIPHLKQATNYSLTICTPSVIIDRFLDMIIILFMAVIGTTFLFTGNQYLTYELIGIGILFCIGLYVLLNKKLMRFFLKLFYFLFFNKKLKKLVHENFDTFYQHIPKKRQLLIPLALTILTWIITYTISYFFALSIGITNIPYYQFITIFPIATIVGMIPITVAGLGTREAVLIGLLAPYGVIAEQAIAISLLGILFSNLPPSLIGGILSLKDDTKLH